MYPFLTKIKRAAGAGVLGEALSTPAAVISSVAIYLLAQTPLGANAHIATDKLIIIFFS